MTNYPGIDYSLGKSNIDDKTGIRYGVISMHAVDFWNEESEPYYIDACPHCGVELNELDCRPEKCNECGNELDESDFDMQEPISFFIDNDEISAEQQADDTDIFVFKSPYFTYAQFCSPCAPGAVHLENPFVNAWENSGTGQSGILDAEKYPDDYKLKAENAGYKKGYCFGHDWFESKPCGLCDNTGIINSATNNTIDDGPERACPDCKGSGEVQVAPYPVYSVESGKIVNPG